MKTHHLISAIIAIAVASLVGCASQPTAEDTAEGEGGVAATGDTQAGTATPLDQDQGLKMDPLSDPNSPLSTRIVYFDYDSAQVRGESMEIITAHGEYLSTNPNQRIRLEGHADERGSREYNLGLGERRATSVHQLLKLQGVVPSQIELISYGEELPAAFGQDEQSWQLNRRVEIVYVEVEQGASPDISSTNPQ